MTTKPSEQILIVPTDLVRECCGSPDLFHGLRTDIENFSPILDTANQQFGPRDSLEEDTNWKQLIPYIVVRYFPANDGEPKYLSYSRAAKQKEQRLASQSSIGVGGHVNTMDAATSRDKIGIPERRVLDFFDNRDTPLLLGMVRELFEEVEIKGVYRCQIAGVLNELGTSVGAVHLGIVFVLDVSSDSVSATDSNVEDLQLLTSYELECDINKYEGWSQLCIDAIRSGQIPEFDPYAEPE